MLPPPPTGYHLLTVSEYGECLRQAGFQDVQAIDNSARFLQILRAELDSFVPRKEEFVKVCMIIQ